MAEEPNNPLPEQSAPQPAAEPRPKQTVPDPRGIILPQKPGSAPSILSAERAPATDALAAANYAAPREGPQAPQRLADIPETAANALPDVPALHTYRGDVAATIEEQRISLADIARASAAHAHKEPKPAAKPWLRTHAWQLAGIVVGLALIIAALGALAFVYLKFRSAPAKTMPMNAPYLYVDSIRKIALAPNETRSALMTTLAADEKSDALSVGLVEQLALTVASTTPSISVPMNTQQFFALVAPQAPSSLTLALNPQFLLGLYAGDGNHPFIVFKTDAYTQAFAGMLAWEYSMPRDLSPLFAEAAPQTSTVATSSTASASSTAAAASSTALSASSTTPIAQSAAPEGQVLGTAFTDTIIDNHDARALKDSNGNIIFFWTFVDQNTLVITTDSQTLQELISRIQNAPTITLPNSH